MRHAPKVMTSMLCPGAKRNRPRPFPKAGLFLTFLLLALMLSSVLTLAEKSAPLNIDFAALKTTASKQDMAQSPSVIEKWQSLLERIPSLPEKEQLIEVNHFFHRHVNYREDINIWNESDYWATPLQTLTRGQGDCEDYSIGKYVSLLQIGVPNERLRLIYVRARIGGPSSNVSRPHMVLAYYESPDDEPLILDSLTRDILPASERTDLFPVFSFNSESLWVGGNRASSTSPTQRLSHWRKVIGRMDGEGIRWKNH